MADDMSALERIVIYATLAHETLAQQGILIVSLLPHSSAFRFRYLSRLTVDREVRDGRIINDVRTGFVDLDEPLQPLELGEYAEKQRGRYVFDPTFIHE